MLSVQQNSNRGWKPVRFSPIRLTKTLGAPHLPMVSWTSMPVRRVSSGTGLSSSLSALDTMLGSTVAGSGGIAEGTSDGGQAS